MTTVVPLRLDSNMWFIIDPLSYEVWIGFIISMPIFLFAMVSANYIFSGHTDFNNQFNFVLRNAFSEQNSRLPNHTNFYQKILILTWLWCMFILVQSYAGNLMAMLASTKLQEPIRVAVQ